MSYLHFNTLIFNNVTKYLQTVAELRIRWSTKHLHLIDIQVLVLDIQRVSPTRFCYSLRHCLRTLKHLLQSLHPGSKYSRKANWLNTLPIFPLETMSNRKTFFTPQSSAIIIGLIFCYLQCMKCIIIIVFLICINYNTFARI